MTLRMLLLMNSRRGKGQRRMAPLTLPAELPNVNIVLLVTGCAVGRELELFRRFTMTIGAGHLAVRAGQREPRFLGVIEFPQVPAIRRVAGRALLTQAAFVHVLRPMAR